MAPALAESLPAARIELGNEVFLRRAWRDLGGRTIGLITNQSGVTSQLESVVNATLRQGRVRVKAIYAPEHGFRGDRNAGASVASYIDPQTHLPVYSLYGASKHPGAQMLDGVDVMCFDIQDVGSRAYTYISTMAYAMQAAKQFNKEFWVLDRPNPIGGAVEGPVLEPPYESFIGLYPIAMRHGMTIGELAGLFNDHFGIGAKLRVVRMTGWGHSMIWPDTRLQWVATSPNIPDWQTTFVYPGTGLLDSAGINNGSGYTKPFFLAGALALDGSKLAARFERAQSPRRLVSPGRVDSVRRLLEGPRAHRGRADGLRSAPFRGGTFRGGDPRCDSRSLPARNPDRERSRARSGLGNRFHSTEPARRKERARDPRSMGARRSEL